MEPQGALLNKTQLGKLFGVCPKTIERWVYQHGLPCVKLGPSRNALIRFDLVQVNEWLQQWKRDSDCTHRKENDQTT